LCTWASSAALRLRRHVIDGATADMDVVERAWRDLWFFRPRRVAADTADDRLVRSSSKPESAWRATAAGRRGLAVSPSIT